MFVSFTLMKPCMPGRNISTLLNLIYFENLFRDIGFSSSYCFVPVYLSRSFKLSFFEFVPSPVPFEGYTRDLTHAH